MSRKPSGPKPTIPEPEARKAAKQAERALMATDYGRCIIPSCNVLTRLRLRNGAPLCMGCRRKWRLVEHEPETVAEEN